MITRFRVEVEGDNQEEVVSELNEAFEVMRRHLLVCQPGDGWEITDEHIAPDVDDDGDAYIAGRRVYRRTWNHA